MKNLTKIFMAVAAMVMAVSCVTDVTEDLGVGVVDQTTLTVSLEESRTQLGEKAGEAYPLYWSVGDQISVNEVVSAALTEGGSAAATFTFKGALNYPYNVVYPASESAGEVTFLASQTYTEGTFCSGAAPMCGYAEEGDPIEMKHLAGALRFEISGGETLSSIIVSTEDAAIAGKFNVDCASGTLTPKAGETSNSVVLSFGEGLELSNTPTPIYVAVPAGSYGKVVVTIYSVEGKKMVAQFDSDAKPIAPGKVREFNSFTFAGDVSDIFIIDSKESLIRFAANPTKSAKVVANIDMTDYNWTPIDGFADLSFDGGNFEIKGLNAPLFGAIAAAEVKNVRLVDVNMDLKAKTFVGALICKVNNGATTAISNCYASGTVNVDVTNAVPFAYTSSTKRVFYGGLVGLNYSTVTSENLTSNVKLSIEGTLSGAQAVIGGVISDQAGELHNATNLGTIDVSASFSTSAIYLGGVTGICRLSQYNVVNGVANDDAKGKITFSGTSGIFHFGGLVAMMIKTMTDCTNYGDMVYSGTANSTIFNGGLIGRIASGDTTFTRCSNYGDLTYSGGGSSANNYVGGILSIDYAEASTLTDCSNHGNVNVTKDFTSTNDFNYGGYIGGKQNDPLHTLTNFLNTGDILYEGNCASLRLGGFVGSYQTHAKLSLNGIVNEGDLNIGGKASGIVRVGGLIGSYAKGFAAISGDYINKGNITCSTVSTYNSTTSKSVCIGGLMGEAAVSLLGPNAEKRCQCDITYTGTVAEGMQSFVGGAIGAVSNSAAYLGTTRVIVNINAPKATYAGLCSGNPRFDNSSTSDKKSQMRACCAGGTIHRAGDDGPVKISVENYAEYFYGDNTLSDNVGPIDNNSYISDIDALPQKLPITTVKNAEELKRAFDENLTATITLANDIDLTGVEWTPIKNFTGTLHGDNHRIIGLTAPLFNTTTGSIENLHLVDVNINESGQALVAALARSVNSAASVVRNCSVSGNITLDVEGFTTADSSLRVAGIVASYSGVDPVDLVNNANIRITGKATCKLGGLASGCIGAATAYLVNCTNLGTINVDAEGILTTLGAGGVAGKCYGATNCVNGDPADKTKGAVTLAPKSSEKMLPSVSGIIGYPTEAGLQVIKCTNYGTVTLGGVLEAAHNYSLASGIASYFKNDTTTPVTVSECINYGDVIVSINSANQNPVCVGGLIAHVYNNNIDYSDCTNYGNIELTSGAKTAGQILVGGIATFLKKGSVSNITNYGNIKVESTGTTSKANEAMIGGIAGRMGDNPITISNNVANYGSIYYNAKAYTTVSLGGLLGKYTAANITVNDSAKIQNLAQNENGEPEIVYGPDATCTSLYLGGVIGQFVDTAGVSYALNATNKADIKCAGDVPATNRIGGVIGGSLTDTNILVSNVECACNIEAYYTDYPVGTTINPYSSIGMLIGCPMADTVKATNSKVGGRIATTAEVDGDAFSMISSFTTLAADTYYNYIYSVPIDEATAKTDGVVFVK